MAIVTNSDLTAIFKTLYPGNVPQDMMLRGHWLAGKLKRKAGFTGYDMKVPVLVGYPAGRSADISILLGGTSPLSGSQVAYFSVTRAKDYAAIQLDSELLMATSDDKGAFVSARRQEMDNLMKQIGNSYAHALYRDGLGTLSTVGSFTGSTITLASKADAKWFYKNQQVQAYDPAGPTLRNSGAYLTVLSVDRDTGIVTFTAGVAATIAAIANADGLVVRGDFNTKLKGLSSWIPLTAPSATTFFGLDRTAAPTELAGHRINDTGIPIDEAALIACERVIEYGGMPDVVTISHKNFRRLSLRHNAKVIIDGGGGSATTGFNKLLVSTSKGDIVLQADPDCPDDRGFALDLGSWTFSHLGDLPEMVKDDGNTALRLSTADAIEMRLRYYGNLWCNAPAHNATFAIGTAL